MINAERKKMFAKEQTRKKAFRFTCARPNCEYKFKKNISYSDFIEGKRKYYCPSCLSRLKMGLDFARSVVPRHERH